MDHSISGSGFKPFPHTKAENRENRITERFNSRFLPDHQVVRPMDLYNKIDWAIFNFPCYLEGVRPLCYSMISVITLHYCPHMVKGRKHQWKQKLVIYRIPALWHTFLSGSHSYISTNKKAINYKKYIKTIFYQYFKILNRPLLRTSFLVFTSFYHRRAVYNR